VLAGMGTLLYVLKLSKPFTSSLSLLVCSSIGSGYGPSSGHDEGPIAAARAQGNTLEAGNSFCGPETMDLICFQVLVFTKFDELREVFFFMVVVDFPAREHVFSCLRQQIERGQRMIGRRDIPC
jgi:hypothetical protein